MEAHRRERVGGRVTIYSVWNHLVAKEESVGKLSRGEGWREKGGGRRIHRRICQVRISRSKSVGVNFLAWADKGLEEGWKSGEGLCYVGFVTSRLEGKEH